MFGPCSCLSPQLGPKRIDLTSPDVQVFFLCVLLRISEPFQNPAERTPCTISVVPSPGVGPVSVVSLPSLPWVYGNSSEHLPHTLKFFFSFLKEIHKWSFVSR